jgi:hypothetical protein
MLNLDLPKAKADRLEYDASQPHRYTSSFPYPRGSQSYTSRGRRGWRGPRGAPAPHRNRTLVLNGTLGTQNSTRSDTAPLVEETDSDPKRSDSGWVRKNDRHRQLINSAVYDQETKSRAKAIEETRRRRMVLRDQRENAKVNIYAQNQMKTAFGVPGKASQAELEVNGIRFRLLAGGSKLVRVKGTRTTSKK